MPAPDPSGAYPSYPLNHTLDAFPLRLAEPDNLDFEDAGTNVGTPPTNFDWETAPVDLDTPADWNFASGGLSSWTTSASNVSLLNTDGPPDAYYAALATTNGTFAQSGAFTVSGTASSFTFSVRFATSTSRVKVYALTGPSFTTPGTLLIDETCATCGWQQRTVNAAPYRGSSVKLRFERWGGTVGVDVVRTQNFATGWDLTGSFSRVANGSGYALSSDGDVTTPAITVDPAAQHGRVTFIGPTGGAIAAQREIYVLSGTGYATSTKVVAQYIAIGTTLTVQFHLQQWAGQSVRIKIQPGVRSVGIDDVGVQRRDIVGGWSVSNPSFSWLSTGPPDDGALVVDGPDGSDGTDPGKVVGLDDESLVSPAIAVPTGAQQVTLKHRGVVSNSGFYLYVQSGATFATETALGAGTLTTSATGDWRHAGFGISAYAGQTVRFRVRSAGGGGRVLLDDVGLLGQLAPGWTVATGSGEIAVGNDAVQGTYLTPLLGTAGFVVSSSRVSLGIADVASGAGDGRSVSLAYAFRASSTSTMKVDWVPVVAGVAGTAQQVYYAAAASATDTGFKDARFTVTEAMLGVDGGGKRVQTGYFKVTGAKGARLYAMADNLARQQLTEPYGYPVGNGIDSATGGFGWADNDLTVEGGPMPLVLNRHYAAHADRQSNLGYRWRHGFDTELYVSAGQRTVAVLHADGAEEAFEGTVATNPTAYAPIDGRVKSTLSLTRDGSNNPLQYTYTTRDRFVYRFSAAGLLLSIANPNASAVATDPANKLTMAYDDYDRLSTVTTGGGDAFAFAYAGTGVLAKLTAVDGPGTLDATYEYDALGDLVGVNLPDDGRIEYAYSRHRLTTVRMRTKNDPDDAAGTVKTLVTNVLDDYNRVVQQKDAAGNALTISYQRDEVDAVDAAGVTSVREAAATDGWTRFFFDHSGRTEGVVSPTDHVTVFVYSARGNLERWIDGADGEYDFAYDANDDATGVTDPYGETTIVDSVNAQHLPTKTTDKLGVVTTNDYDAKGNLLQRVVDAGTGSGHLNLMTRWEYDATTGWPLREIRDPALDKDGISRGSGRLNLVTEYGYDTGGKGRVVSRTVDPGSSPHLNLTTTYEYTPAGRLAVETDPSGHRVRYQYTALGRLFRVYVDPALKPDNTAYTGTHLDLTTQYVHDMAGRLIVTRDPACVARGVGDECQTEWLYDDRGLVQSKWFVFDVSGGTAGADIRTAYEYDAAQRMTAQVVDADDGVGTTLDLKLRTEYRYDAEGRLEFTVVDPTDPAVAGTELNLTTRYVYDERGGWRRRSWTRTGRR